jgi:hypothetical protein
MSSKQSNDYLSTIQNIDERTIIYLLIGIIFIVLFILIWYVFNINASPNQTSNYLSILENIDENTLSLIITGITVIIIIGFILYMVYLSRLQSSECSHMNKLYPSVDGNLRSISDSDPDCSGNLYDYYIKAAYNACSGGSYKNDYVDICVLKSIIKQGVRCLDFEIYSIDDQPIVATSTTNNYHVKETLNYVNFATVMDTIRNNAFSGDTCPNPSDPILIHLRFKSNNQKMYSKLAEIFESYNDLMLGPAYSYESEGKNLGNFPLLSLKNKIVLIADRTNSAFFENQRLLEYINLTSNSMFMREYEYSDIKNNPDTTELSEFNRVGMTIVLPNKGSNPSNPDGEVCRESGCQIVAMRYQLSDKNLKENTKFFDKASYAFALKPLKLRYRTPENNVEIQSTNVTVEIAENSTNNEAATNTNYMNNLFSNVSTSFGSLGSETKETDPDTTLLSFGSGLTSFGITPEST